MSLNKVKIKKKECKIVEKNITIAYYKGERRCNNVKCC